MTEIATVEQVNNEVLTYHFEQSNVDRVVTFIQTFCKHYQGAFAGRPFRLLDWQIEKVIAPIFGWVDQYGMRKHKTCFIFLPRKNGKSALSAAIALYMLFGDGEEAAEIYSGASTRDQASIVFSAAANMIAADKHLRSRCDVSTSQKYIQTHNNRKYKVLASDGYSAFGSNPSCIITDEIAFWQKPDLYTALVTGMKFREQPLIINITTASNFMDSKGRELYEYAKNIQSGVKQDDSFYGYLCEAPEGADIGDAEVWKAVNPALGTRAEVIAGDKFLNIKSFHQDYVKGLNEPSEMRDFKMTALNIWVAETTSPYIPLTIWDKCDDPLPPIEEMVGKECYAGLDLSHKNDLTAFVLCFPVDGKYLLYPHFFTAGDGIVEKERLDGQPYRMWEQQGYITIVPGPVVEHSFVLEHIYRQIDLFDLHIMAYDQYGSDFIIEGLKEWSESGTTDKEYYKLKNFRQGFLSMNQPTKDYRDQVLLQNIVHGRHPILRWNMSCSTTVSDASGNIKVVKDDYRKANKRVDGTVASIMAFGMAQANKKEQPTTDYGALSQMLDEMMAAK